MEPNGVRAVAPQAEAGGSEDVEGSKEKDDCKKRSAADGEGEGSNKKAKNDEVSYPRIPWCTWL